MNIEQPDKPDLPPEPIDPYKELEPMAKVLAAYRDQGYLMMGQTKWTSTPKGVINAGSYTHTGQFTLASHELKPDYLVINSILKEDGTNKPQATNVLQHYVQFRDWDLSTQGVSYMNLVCNVKVSTKELQKVGSCGPEVLAGQSTGPYTKIKGSTPAANAALCNTDAIFSLDETGFPFNVTDTFG